MRRLSKKVPNCVPLSPGLEKDADDPCWDGYVMLGMKPKNAKRRTQMRRNKKASGGLVELKNVKIDLSKNWQFPTNERDLADYIEYDIAVIEEELVDAIEDEYDTDNELPDWDGTIQDVAYLKVKKLDIDEMDERGIVDGYVVLDIDVQINAPVLSRRRARFSEGEKGRKEFEKWKAEQPEEFQEEWDANTEEYGDKFKKAGLSISDYRRMLTAKPINQGVFESGAALSGVDPALAKYFIEEGDDDGDPGDDVIKVNKGSTKATKLKPSQTTMVPINSVGMALAMLNGVMDTDLGAIIASDGQIMDGHHRWAGAILAYGGAAKVGGYFAKLPGKELVRVLNTFTKGKFNRGGKSGQGNISDFKPAVVREILEDGLVNGVTSTKGFKTSPADVEKALKTLGNGDVQAGIQIMSDNASKINKAVPSWAPKRKDMPVIEPEEVPLASKYMSQGLMDWAPPYKNASRRRVSSFRSAGILNFEELEGILSKYGKVRSNGESWSVSNPKRGFTISVSLEPRRGYYVEYSGPNGDFDEVLPNEFEVGNFLALRAKHSVGKHAPMTPIKFSSKRRASFRRRG